MATNSSTALITGGTSGIGRAVTNKLAQLGIHVLVVGRNAERGEKTVAEIRAAGGEADFISSDLRDASSAREVARRAVALGNGHVDILINNAGVFPFGPLAACHSKTVQQPVGHYDLSMLTERNRHQQPGADEPDGHHSKQYRC
jgi:NAD(P)-dependent dehydrogenase (short-subunit alcohol dehydrogenase family)